MRRLTYKFAGCLLTAIFVSVSITQCTESAGLDENQESGNEMVIAANEETELTAAEIEGIIFMREEEKLARDVYLYLYDIFPLRPFLNISKSEQAHMDAIMYLIDTFGLVDPVGDHPQGVFQNEELQDLYNDLIEQGSTSEEEALKVGALIEEVDIIDLQTELDSIAENEEVIRIYTNLCNASENHLRAFTRVLSRYGVEYVPLKLSQEEFDRILAE